MAVGILSGLASHLLWYNANSVSNLYFDFEVINVGPQTALDNRYSQRI